MGAASVIKYLLFFFNLLLCIGGLVLLALGIVALVSVKGNDDMTFNSISIAFIVLGGTIFLVAFLGCCGAIRESSCMLTSFGIFLSTVFTIQLVGAILIFVFQNDLKNGARKTLLDSLKNYSRNEYSKVFWDDLQRDLKCCGVNGPSDWLYNQNREVGPLSGIASGIASVVGKVIERAPESCACKESSLCDLNGNYKDGCYHKVISAVVTYGIILAAVAIGIALVELIGSCFAFRLASTYRSRQHGIY